jgi:hypothetical protein
LEKNCGLRSTDRTSSAAHETLNAKCYTYLFNSSYSNLPTINRPNKHIMQNLQIFTPSIKLRQYSVQASRRKAKSHHIIIVRTNKKHTHAKRYSPHAICWQRVKYYGPCQGLGQPRGESCLAVAYKKLLIAEINKVNTYTMHIF